jgi:hypothetical protein
MAGSRDIAGLVGPSLMAIAASEAINLRIWATSLAPVVYLNGAVLFVAGLAIVRSHNLWTRDWRVLVTLMGWLGMLAGLYRMFAPEARQGGENLGTYVVIAALFALGLVLTFNAYRSVPPPRR